MEPALEWLFKLYSLGLIRGVIDGKEMIEAVWKSASSGEDVVDLAVLKVIFSAVRFPVVEVPNGLNVMRKLEWISGEIILEWTLGVETSVLNIVKKALELFAKMPERDTVSWNTMISILSQHGFGAETLNTFLEMWNQVHICHARIVRMEPRLDSLMQSLDLFNWGSCTGWVSRRSFEGQYYFLSMTKDLCQFPCSIHQLALKASSIDSSIKCRLGDSEANCSSLSSNNLSSLANLYDGLGNLLLVPLSQQVMV
ncbi:hypothetical protein CK203_060054 [Vitis vinifera]|uniref:Pentatricopeptide repeat-containing protein n=1 Tax=Vitis vinifera TaxID=29760 RepID=A0A438GK53_VITVI|nr:hypothetical protein CK203_060054 [Vitis vinifera]